MTVCYSWIHKWYPYFFFKASDIAEQYLSKNSEEKDHQRFDVVVGKRKAEGAVKRYTSGELKGLVYIEFDAVDAWFEEEEQIFVHPKDPYKVRTSL